MVATMLSDGPSSGGFQKVIQSRRQEVGNTADAGVATHLFAHDQPNWQGAEVDSRVDLLEIALAFRQYDLRNSDTSA